MTKVQIELAELAEVMNCPKFQVILARSSTDPDQALSELRRWPDEDLGWSPVCEH